MPFIASALGLLTQSNSASIQSKAVLDVLQVVCRAMALGLQVGYLQSHFKGCIAAFKIISHMLYQMPRRSCPLV